MLLELTVASLLHLVPADTSTWQIEGDVSGFPVKSVCTVQVVDTVLTGNCTSDDGGTYEIKGQVQGENVTFSHEGDYEGEPLMVTYSGTAQSETEVRGTIDVQPFNVTGYFTARQVADPAPQAP